MTREAWIKFGQVLTFLAYVASAALLFVLVDDHFRLTRSTALLTLWHIVPAVGGAAILPYVVSVKKWGIKLCAHPAVQLFAAALLIMCFVSIFATLPLRLVVRPGAMITIDSLFKPLDPRATEQVVRVKGLTSHRIEVTEKYPEAEFADTIVIGAWDMLRSWLRNNHTPSDPYRIGSSRHLSVNSGGTARSVTVSGTNFPEFYLREISRFATVVRGDTTKVMFQLYMRPGLSEEMRVPAGTYHVQLDSAPCQALARGIPATFDLKDVPIDFKVRCDQAKRQASLAQSNDTSVRR